MAKRNRSNSPARLEARLKEGRGQGRGGEYQPWLRIQQRFKGVGMRWSDDGFNHLLLLRLT